VVLIARANSHASECGIDCACQVSRASNLVLIARANSHATECGVDCACKLSRDLNVVVIARAKSKNSTLLSSRAKTVRFCCRVQCTVPSNTTFIFFEDIVPISVIVIQIFLHIYEQKYLLPYAAYCVIPSIFLSFLASILMSRA